MRSTTGHSIPDDLPEEYTYNGDGTVATITVTDSTSSRVWVQTFTWLAGQLVSVSGWVLQ